MTLLERISEYDSIQEMEQARDDRFWDGLACALESRHLGSCYLFGYAIEMSLKTAYFRFSGIPITEDLAAHLKTARRLPRFSGASNLHDVNAWAEHLLEARQRALKPIQPELAGQLVHYTTWVAQNWSETMRYRASIPASDEAERLLFIVEWLRDTHTSLWS